MMVGDIFMEGWPHRGLSIYTIVSDIKNFTKCHSNNSPEMTLSKIFVIRHYSVYKEAAMTPTFRKNIPNYNHQLCMRDRKNSICFSHQTLVHRARPRMCERWSRWFAWSCASSVRNSLKAFLRRPGL